MKVVVALVAAIVLSACSKYPDPVMLPPAESASLPVIVSPGQAPAPPAVTAAPVAKPAPAVVRPISARRVAADAAEQDAYLLAARNAERAQCLCDAVDIKIEFDIRNGEIMDAGSVVALTTSECLAWVEYAGSLLAVLK